MDNSYGPWIYSEMGMLTTFIDSLIEECVADLNKWRQYTQIAKFITEKKVTTALGFACYSGVLRLVKVLIDQGADINEEAGEGLSPLHILCQANMFLPENENIARLLLESKVEVNKRNSSGQTALHMACLNNKLQMAKILIEGGAEVNTVDVHGHSPFWESCNRASIMLSAWLHGQFNADPCRRYASIDISIELIKAGADPKQGTLLPFVIVFQKLYMVHAVLDAGFDVNMKDDHGRTALDFTPEAFDGPHKVLKVLIEKGMIFNPRDHELKTDLILAAYKQGDIDMLVYFLSFGHVLRSWEMGKIPYPNLSEWALSGKETIDMDSKLLAWNLLIKAGFPTKFNEITKLVNDVAEKSERSDVSSIMKDALLPFFTLSDLCRVIIRSRLRRPINCHVDSLTLPVNLKGFLKFEDFTLQARCITLGEMSVS